MTLPQKSGYILIFSTASDDIPILSFGSKGRVIDVFRSAARGDFCGWGEGVRKINQNLCLERGSMKNRYFLVFSSYIEHKFHQPARGRGEFSIFTWGIFHTGDAPTTGVAQETGVPKRRQ